jgi:hypothetical protein
MGAGQVDAMLSNGLANRWRGTIASRVDTPLRRVVERHIPASVEIDARADARRAGRLPPWTTCA